MCRVIDVMAQMTVKVIDVLAFLGYRCPGSSHLRLTFVPEASAGRSPCPTAQVATGMNRQFPGRDSHPLVICAFVAHPIYCG